MRTKPNKPTPVVVEAKHPSREKGELKYLGRLRLRRLQQCARKPSDKVALGLLTRTVTSARSSASAAVAALVGIGPRDELEGMLAAQMIAAHSAAMECYRRAMLPEQPFEGWRKALTQANKLSRTYATLLESLNRHRGKGQQKVTVEHVHVHQGAQAIVGAVEAGGGVLSGKQRQAHEPEQQRTLASAPSAPVWSEDPSGAALPSAAGEGRAQRQ